MYAPVFVFPPSRRFRVRLDALSLAAIAVALVSYMWMGTWMDYSPGLAGKANYAALLLVAGLAGGFLYTRTSIDPVLTPGELSRILVWTVASIVAIAAAFTVPLAVSAATSLVILIAVAEEVFFRYFITSLFMDYLGSKPLAAALSGIVFGLYHAAAYGPSVHGLAPLAIAGAVLAYAYLDTGRLTPTIIAHLAINYLAVAG